MKIVVILAWAISLASVCKAQRAEAREGWIITTDTSPMDSVKTVTALTDSVEDPVADLVIRCKGKHAEVFVAAHETVSEEYGVRIKFDNGRPTKQSWERATGYDALFSPVPGDLLRKLMSAKTFYLEYTPYQKAARVVSFDVSKELPPEVLAACVTSEIERAEARAKKAVDERIKLLAQEKRQREDEEKRLAALRDRCAAFERESLEEVETSQAPLPPHECWEVLEWMHGSDSYEDLVKKRGLCALPSFAKDPSFCPQRSSSSGK
jgi:hypothetical protein